MNTHCQQESFALFYIAKQKFVKICLDNVPEDVIISIESKELKLSDIRFSHVVEKEELLL